MNETIRLDILARQVLQREQLLLLSPFIPASIHWRL
jgi:hypothetical protein